MKITIKSTPTLIRMASSIPARCASPIAGAAKEDHPVITKPRVLATFVITIATNPKRAACLPFVKYAPSAKTPKIKRIMPSMVPSRWLTK
ncbi:MAG TPA: hypothetical protein VHF65_09515 [Nitrososphaera sp.]|nr:hypothetical protein [Nitrososphaera sp.]